MDDRFPDIHLPTRDFSGTMFKDLPIVNVKASMNNTLINVTDPNGKCKINDPNECLWQIFFISCNSIACSPFSGLVQTMRSCGYDGFKNARKGTNVAAQATGFTFGKVSSLRSL